MSAQLYPDPQSQPLLPAPLAAHAVRETPRASAPLLLNGDAIRVVESGAIDLFHVELRDGMPVRARIHLCRLGPGDALFAFPGSAQDCLLAVPLPDSVCLRLAGDAAALLADEARAPLLMPLLARWHAQLEAALPGARFTGMAPQAAHEALLRLLQERRRQLLLRDEAKLRARIDGDAQSLRRALAGVVEAMDGSSLAGAASAGQPLADACALVLKAAGIRLRQQLAPAPADADIDAWLDGFCNRAGIARRRIALAGIDWWKQDFGPVLAFRLRDNAPLALLPHAGGYRVLDPASGVTQMLDGAGAASLARSAVMFFRRFPARPIGLAALLRFGLAGTMVDRARLIGFGLAGGLLGLATPFVTGLLIDAALPAADRGMLMQIVLMLVVTALAVTGFSFCRGLAAMRVQTRIGNAAQAAVVDRLLHLPAPFFRDYEAGALARRALAIDSILLMIGNTAESAMFGWLFGLFNLFYLFFIDFRLALAALALVTLELTWTLALNYLALLQERRSLKINGDVASKVLQLLSGIAKLRAHGAERRAFALWAGLYARQRTIATRVRRIGITLATIDAGYGLVCSIALFAMVVWLIPDIVPGQFIAFASAFAQFLAATLGLSAALTATLSVIPQYERAKPILQATPEFAGSGQAAGKLSGAIDICKVCFRYQPDGPLILDDVSISVRPGEFIALVGPSGSGKSTLCRLLLGFEQAQAGAIHYDGRDLAGLDVVAVRRQLGVVLQNGRLMAGDVFSNIVGSAPLSLDDAWEAARMAGLEPDIQAMPMGMHTVISEGAGTISGGQKQRLLIARAVVKKPRILLFDEATSALDNHTQAIVAQSLARLNATRIVVAHRLSTIVEADRIYFMEGGRIVEQGRYEELMMLGGRFAALAQRQIV